MNAGSGDHDILIAGGGPVGSALALALADGRRRIAVVEAGPGPGTGDTRATVLAAGSVRLLDALGAWPRLAGDAVPIHCVEVSARGSFGRTRLAHTDVDVDALGRVVSHDRLAAALADAARAAAGVEWLSPARVTALPAVEDGRRPVDIARDGGAERHTARLVVAADGSHSTTRDLLGIAAERHDYGQTAFLLEVCAGGAATTAHERFADDGTLALLPAGGARRTLVWTMSEALGQARRNLDADALAALIGARLGRQLQPVRVLSSPRPWPLRQVRAAAAIAPRAVLAGNAASTLHPVAAQGFNLAMREVCSLAEALDAGSDPGDEAALAAWDRSRRFDRDLVRGFTDVLARGFGHGGPGPLAMRAGLLSGIDLCPLARDALSAYGTGLGARLPRVGNWRPPA